jgi:hypothetical protein
MHQRYILHSFIGNEMGSSRPSLLEQQKFLHPVKESGLVETTFTGATLTQIGSTRDRRTRALYGTLLDTSTRDEPGESKFLE